METVKELASNMRLEPHHLGCGHTFCRGCLKDAHASGMLLCPMCRQEISGREWAAVLTGETPGMNAWRDTPLLRGTRSEGDIGRGAAAQGGWAGGGAGPSFGAQAALAGAAAAGNQQRPATSAAAAGRLQPLPTRRRAGTMRGLS